MRSLTRASPGRAALISGGTAVALVASGSLALAGCGVAKEGVRKEGPARADWTSSASALPEPYRKPSSSTAPPHSKVDPVALIKADPKVSAGLKAELKPCVKRPGSADTSAQRATARAEAVARGSTKGGAAKTTGSTKPTGTAQPNGAPSGPPGVTTDSGTAAPDKKGRPAADSYPIGVSYGRLTGEAGTDLVVNVSTCFDSFGVGAYVYREEGGKYQNVFTAEHPPVYADIDQGDLRVTQLAYALGDAVCCPSGEDVLTYRWSRATDKFTLNGRTHTDYSTIKQDDLDDLTQDGPPAKQGREG